MVQRLPEIMFEQYISLDQIVKDGHAEQIKQELNGYPLYTFMVRLFGFKEIGIIALNEQGRETSRYASHNNERGEIMEIVEHFEKPDIAVKAKERDLVAILHHAEKIKQHPIISILLYGPRFRLAQGKYARVEDYVDLFLTRAFTKREKPAAEVTTR